MNVTRENREIAVEYSKLAAALKSLAIESAQFMSEYKSQVKYRKRYHLNESLTEK
jgi:hypothetical protein